MTEFSFAGELGDKVEQTFNLIKYFVEIQKYILITSFEFWFLDIKMEFALLFTT